MTKSSFYLIKILNCISHPKQLMKKILFLFYFLTSVLFLAQKDYVHSITQKQQFINLAGRPLTDKFTNVKSVKVVYDYSAKKLYFFNSIKYKYHHDF